MEAEVGVGVGVGVAVGQGGGAYSLNPKLGRTGLVLTFCINSTRA